MAGKERELGSVNRSQGVRSSIFAAMVYYSRTASIKFIMSFANPTQEEIKRLLGSVSSVAVVGLSPNAARPSFRVAKGLQDLGYRIIPVRPLVSDALGEKAFPDLHSLPERPDIVDVFRAPQHIPDIVESCIALGIENLWLQDGIVHEAAALRAQQAGITVVMNRCMWRDANTYGIHAKENTS